MRSYDAIVVLGGGLRCEEGRYQPSTYKDGDEFGMLGGDMRVRAAVALVAQGVARMFVFTTGVYAKMVSQFGWDVPAEAGIYGQRFTELLKSAGLLQPDVILEERSVNTVTNIIEVVAIARARRWRDILVVSSEYHIERVRALYTLMQRQRPAFGEGLCVDFIGAEGVVKAAWPGRFDQEIDEAYASELAKKRFDNEAAGLLRIRSGEYTLGEFQLSR